MAFEVICVTTDSGSPSDDCRRIETIGYKTLLDRYRKSPEAIHDEIKNGRDFYIEQNGSKTYLEAAERNDIKYVRTESSDTRHDDLLRQPSCWDSSDENRTTMRAVPEARLRL